MAIDDRRDVGVGEPGQHVVADLPDEARAQAAGPVDALDGQGQLEALQVPDGVGQDVNETAATERGDGHVIAGRGRRGRRGGHGSNLRGAMRPNHVLTSLRFRSIGAAAGAPGRTRTGNLRIRRPMPPALPHGIQHRSFIAITAINPRPHMVHRRVYVAVNVAITGGGSGLSDGRRTAPLRIAEVAPRLRPGLPSERRNEMFP